jgi:hypothetical protein
MVHEYLDNISASRIFLDHVGGLFTDHDGWRMGIARDNFRSDCHIKSRLFAG